MKTILLLFFIPLVANAAPAYLYDANGNPITSTAGALNIAGSITASNPSVGTAGAAAPTSNTLIGGKDGSGNLQPIGVNGSNALKVDGSAVTQPVSGTFWQATQPVSAASLPLPTGASTSAKQPALGTAGTASSDVITVQGIASMTALKVDGSAVTQPVSAASLPLPSGAATSANQTNGTQQTQIVQGGNTAAVTASSALKVDGSAVTQPVSVASAISTKSPVNTNGSFAQITTLTTVAQTLSVPANAVGFVLESYSGNANNVRFAIGSTATTSAGFVLEPGRDSGFIPAAANVSVIATAGTNQEVDIQWVLSQ